MKGFTTTIKTPYTNMPVSREKKFKTQYTSKSGRKVISGENRSVGKKFSSCLINK